MGNPKLKWTPEEEDSLRAGVAKHGTEKWKDILGDPEFAQKLANRSNIDLKDKWCNISVAVANDSAPAALPSHNETTNPITKPPIPDVIVRIKDPNNQASTGSMEIDQEAAYLAAYEVVKAETKAYNLSKNKKHKPNDHK